jgi:hypothetical protein
LLLELGGRSGCFLADILCVPDARFVGFDCSFVLWTERQVFINDVIVLILVVFVFVGSSSMRL